MRGWLPWSIRMRTGFFGGALFLGLGVPPREDWVAGESVREGGWLGAALSPILRVLKGVVLR